MIPFTPSHRTQNKENEPPEFSLPTPRTLFCAPLQQPAQLLFSTPLTPSSSLFTPPPTARNPRKRRIAATPSLEDISRYKVQRQEWMEQKKLAEETAAQAQKTVQLRAALQGIKQAGFSTLNSFFEDLLTAKDPSQSSQISQLLINHGPRLFTLAQERQPQITNEWIVSSHSQLIDQQCRKLAAHFRPQQLSSVTRILDEFSIKGFLAEAEIVAPLVCQVVRQVGIESASSDEPCDKDRELILATTLCMLAKCRNNHATEFQTTISLYLLACGTSRSLFNVLNHAGLTLSYTQAMSKLKMLGHERLELTRKVAHSTPFMLVWDNVNIAFKVSEQRHDSKDHFDNGTTATLIPLYGVQPGGLPTSLKPRRVLHTPVLNFTADDILPSATEALRVQDSQIWHIMDILFDAFPDLRHQLKDSILPLPSVMQIPVHTTEQYPLPTMHIDESSLEGTLAVFDTILKKSLKLTEDDVERNGIILCAGDQLSMSLLDKVSAIRRDDTTYMDNIGQYTEGQDGLFHIKLAHTRMVANEFWGKANAKSPWSLWRMNTLLGRKAVSAGWAAKSLPPFRPMWELILNLVLPANILDGFRIHCGHDKLIDWVDSIQTEEDVRKIATKLHQDLCSARRVSKLRRETQPTKRDVPLENICLFNRDALYLRQLKYAIKRGDVGAVLDIISHLMLAFRGTGKTPKYADALFRIVVNLKRMDPTLRMAWLTNWLANLSGKENGFKEMDLLQEHQNFWLKIIYNAKGSNRTWDWLAMVSVSIFALRDVIRKVHIEFATPFNSTAHTSPSTREDIKIICEYLEQHTIQTYTPQRAHNDDATEARDLLADGAAYANRPNAFRNFTHTKFSTKNYGFCQAPAPDASEEHENEEDEDGDGDEYSIDSGADPQLDVNDLMLDSEEFPERIAQDYVAMMHEVIDELGRSEL